MNRTLLIIGIVAVVLGIIAKSYSVTTSQSHLWGLYSTASTSTPYSSLSIPLLIAGIVLGIVGVVIKDKR